MSKYFIDTEFLEGTQMKRFMGMNVGNTKPTIDLISIGIVCEDDREYYAVSKDFNLKEAWNRYDIKNRWIEKCPEFSYTENYKDYWIRENVLKPIYKELVDKEFESDLLAYYEYPFTYSSTKYLIKKYGKSNEQIAEEIKEFTKVSEKEYPVKCQCQERVTCYECEEISKHNSNLGTDVQFYGYYSDYDWVAFCWLFGKMIDLPSGFPMYCSDLKQTLDDMAKSVNDNVFNSKNKCFKPTLEDKINYIKSYPKEPFYPKQTNEHNSLCDAKWTKQLYEFLNKL